MPKFVLIVSRNICKFKEFFNVECLKNEVFIPGTDKCSKKPNPGAPTDAYGKCECKPGYIRNPLANNECVLDCMHKKCKVLHEKFYSCLNICPIDCLGNAINCKPCATGCFCDYENGYLRDPNTNKCVLKEDCSGNCKNFHRIFQ